MELFFLFMAGLLGGMLNSIAGGGTFITFPALLFSGLPPVSANATNTFAACSGYISGAVAFRQEIKAYKQELPKLLLISLLGGMTGAWLLLQTPDKVFQEAIPWLLLFATILFIFGRQINHFFKDIASRNSYIHSAGSLLLMFLLLLVCIYGGFFNAALGIIILSYLALAGYTDINAMNGLKLIISSCVSLIAIIIFIMDGLIVWFEGTAVLVGTLVGGYIAAHASRQIPQQKVKSFVSIISILITGYFFYDVYL